MAIESPQRKTPGQELYEVLRECVARLARGDQMALGFAIQRRAEWHELGEDQQQAFEDAREDLQT